MTPHLMKASTVASWILGIFLFFAAASRAASSIPYGIALETLGMLTALLLWFWWNDPEPTLSESIHEVRNAASPRAPVSFDRG
jgi:hypothetical protein